MCTVGTRRRRRHGARDSRAGAAAALLALAVLLAAPRPARAGAIVIGAGVSGLKAALDLLSQGIAPVTILEARARVGGRVETLQTQYGPVELGAQWIHGQPNVLT